jgi:hypothetical protein
MTKPCVLALCLLLFPCISHGSESASPAAQAVHENEDLFNPFPAGFMSPPDQPEGWVALPPGRPFPSLLSDPLDLKLALRRNNKGEIEAEVGGYRSFVGWKGRVKGRDTVIHLGLEGNGYFLMHEEGAKFPLSSTDGLIGLYTEGIRGLWLYQLRYTHVSAHLSDGLFGFRDRIVYTRETLSLRLARQLGFVRAYGGYHFLVHTEPKLPRSSLQLGAYAIFPWHWQRVHPYFGGDIRLRDAAEGNTFQITGGAALVSSLGAPPLRLSLNYLKGHDLRGQFFREKTEKWSLGLELDF